MPERAIGKAEIIRLLGEGWELGIGHGLHARAWMQKDGLGRGGKSANARIDSAMSVIRSGAAVAAGYGPGLSTRYIAARPTPVDGGQLEPFGERWLRLGVTQSESRLTNEEYDFIAALAGEVDRLAAIQTAAEAREERERYERIERSERKSARGWKP